MANKKISEFMEASQINDGDMIPILQDGDNKKISFENLKSEILETEGVVTTIEDNLESESKTNALSARQGKMLNEKIKRKVATASLTTGIDITGANQILLDKIISNDKELTLVNGSIRIGKNIKKVLVSANCFAIGDSDDYLWTYILKQPETVPLSNSNNISIALDNTSSRFGSTSHSPVLVEVNEGDIICLYKMVNSTYTIRSGANTYLTVEVVE